MEEAMGLHLGGRPGPEQGHVPNPRLPESPCPSAVLDICTCFLCRGRVQTSRLGTSPPQGPTQDTYCAIRLVCIWEPLPEGGLQLLREQC